MFTAKQYFTLDHETRDWESRYGWEPINIGGTGMEWRKRDRKIEFYPNTTYAQFGPIEVRVDGLAYKERFYDTPHDALRAVQGVLSGREGPRKGALRKRKPPQNKRRRRPQSLAEARSYLIRARGWGPSVVDNHPYLLREAQQVYDDHEVSTVRTIAGPKRVGGRRSRARSAHTQVRKAGDRRWVLVVGGRQVAAYATKREANELADALNEMTLAQARREVGI